MKVFFVNYEMCSAQSCGLICIKKCPMVISEERKKHANQKKEVPIRYKNSTNRVIIISEICVKCGICVNVCPRKAIYSINMLEEPLERVPTHTYPPVEGSKGFNLYGHPTLVPGRVTGLCGPNGIGKSTMLNILSEC